MDPLQKSREGPKQEGPKQTYQCRISIRSLAAPLPFRLRTWTYRSFWKHWLSRWRAAHLPVLDQSQLRSLLWIDFVILVGTVLETRLWNVREAFENWWSRYNWARFLKWPLLGNLCQCCWDTESSLEQNNHCHIMPLGTSVCQNVQADPLASRRPQTGEYGHVNIFVCLKSKMISLFRISCPVLSFVRCSYDRLWPSLANAIEHSLFWTRYCYSGSFNQHSFGRLTT